MPHTLINSFGKPYLITEWDEANQWLYNRWMGLLSTENVIQGAVEGLNLMQQTGATAILNDNREVTGSWNQANEYLAQEWMPRAVALGLRRFAHVLAPGIFAQMSAEQLHVHVGSQFEMQLFNDLDTARQWLQAARLATSA
ncbi:STAS/SEC14 domain-containing protein [Hymenobacter rigui]|uniref:STAS/SEC14 domain-containing protein n=1 Tax=Hymenobacter rigui TaxID=334424 RepID=A0A3R9MSF1_9BACT|nr:hypothetical protein [Hymenobacter rigui]RSK48925.1 hypothetical protein EI291_10215 [Hymenobacter rigui]